MTRLIDNSRRFITKQYDQRVGLNTVHDCEYPIAVLRLPDSGRGLGIAVGCRPEIMRLDAKIGAYDSVAYPALQLAAQGIQTLAITDCLNFGNPEKPEIMSEFVASVDAISEMAKALDAPVVSGNVSFYNETLGKNITSTPATGLIGLRKDIQDLKSAVFKNAGEEVYLVSLNMLNHQGVWTDVPSWSGTWNSNKVVEFINRTLKLAQQQSIQTVRAVGSQGVQSSLHKMCLEGMGFQLISQSLLESQSTLLYQLIISGTDLKKTLEGIFTDSMVSLLKIGETVPDQLILDDQTLVTSELKSTYEKAWGKYFENLA